MFRQSGNRFGDKNMHQVVGLARILSGEMFPSRRKAR